MDQKCLREWDLWLLDISVLVKSSLLSHLYAVREAARKKVPPLLARPLSPPPPSSLMVIESFRKSFFSLLARPLPPPPYCPAHYCTHSFPPPPVFSRIFSFFCRVFPAFSRIFLWESTYFGSIFPPPPVISAFSRIFF